MPPSCDACISDANIVRHVLIASERLMELLEMFRLPATTTQYGLGQQGRRRSCSYAAGNVSSPGASSSPRLARGGAREMSFAAGDALFKSLEGRLVYFSHGSSSLVAAQCTSASCPSSPTKRNRLPIMSRALPSLPVIFDGRWIVTGNP